MQRDARVQLTEIGSMDRLNSGRVMGFCLVRDEVACRTVKSEIGAQRSESHTTARSRARLTNIIQLGFGRSLHF